MGAVSPAAPWEPSAIDTSGETEAAGGETPAAAWALSRVDGRGIAGTVSEAALGVEDPSELRRDGGI